MSQSKETTTSKVKENNELKKLVVLELLTQCLGEPKDSLYYPQLQFNCPKCAEAEGIERDNKYNLEVNVEYEKFNCWKCDESEQNHGDIERLFFIYSDKAAYEEYRLFAPNQFVKREYKKITALPNGFKIIDTKTPSKIEIEALNYLRGRGITDEMVTKYQFGLSTEYNHIGRVVLPSHDNDGHVNYYLSRSYTEAHKAPYHNPDNVEKTDIVFNENLINWDCNVHIVEGGFDHIVVPNSIPMLGKKLYDKLYELLYNNCKGNIIIWLDIDAWAEAKSIYKKLNQGKFRNRVKLIKVPSIVEHGRVIKLDPSKIYEREGPKGIAKKLKTAFTIPEFEW